ncbi:MAG: ABC transporter substrate-binding protein [Clostridiales Family XIII bacterium]|jgi:ABC-type transport system substrate-binding protein|nr:ABC transporter substrate-binding protein [Clostridiales Family XIII bacterium]
MTGRKKWIRRLVAAAAVLVVVIALVACGGQDEGEPPAGEPAQGGTESSSDPATPAAGEPQYGGTLRVIWDISADTKQQFGVPSLATRAPNVICVPCYEGLLIETTFGDYEPWLAEEYTAFPDKGEVVFKIRKGVKFHDGTDMTPEVVAWNINRVIEEGKQDKNYLRAEVRGEDEVVLFMENYMNSYEGFMASKWLAIISKDSFDQYGPEEAQNHPVGTGPFKVDEINPGQNVKFVKFEDYWQEGKPYLDAVEYVEITDLNTQKTALTSATGDQAVDVLYCSNVQQASALEALDGIHLEKRPGGPLALYPDSMNKDSPLSNQKVREAISMALDRDALMAAQGFGVNTPAYQYVPEGFPAHLPESENAPGFDLEKAKALLAEAGYPDGFEVLLWTGSATPGISKDTNEAMATMLRALGLTVKTEYLTNAEKNDREMTGYEGLLASTIRPLPVIMTTYRMKGWDPEFLYYPSLWRPLDQTQQLYEDAWHTETVDTEMVQELHRIMLQNMTHIPVYDTYDVFAVKETVHDGFFADYGLGTVWRPDLCWKEQQ